MLTPNQRMYLAYRYYLDQIKRNPSIAHFVEQKTETRVQLSKEPTEYDGKHSGDEPRPIRPRNSRDETITDRVPSCADPMNDIPVLAVPTIVEATSTRRVPWGYGRGRSVNFGHGRGVYVTGTVENER